MAQTETKTELTYNDVDNLIKDGDIPDDKLSAVYNAIYMRTEENLADYREKVGISATCLETCLELFKGQITRNNEWIRATIFSWIIIVLGAICSLIFLSNRVIEVMCIRFSGRNFYNLIELSIIPILILTVGAMIIWIVGAITGFLLKKLMASHWHDKSVFRDKVEDTIALKLDKKDRSEVYAMISAPADIITRIDKYRQDVNEQNYSKTAASVMSIFCAMNEFDGLYNSISVGLLRISYWSRDPDVPIGYQGHAQQESFRSYNIDASSTRVLMKMSAMLCLILVLLAAITWIVGFVLEQLTMDAEVHLTWLCYVTAALLAFVGTVLLIAYQTQYGKNTIRAFLVCDKDVQNLFEKIMRYDCYKEAALKLSDMITMNMTASENELAKLALRIARLAPTTRYLMSLNR